VVEKTEHEKMGIFSGVHSINPANQEKIPIWIADYVLGDVGTGAIMAVPAHDQRDFEFAKKFNLPIKMVICPNYPAPICPILDRAYEGEGYLVGSGKFDGMDSEKAKWEITKLVGGKKKIQYKLRDWVFSRQRYWGEPIPLVFCDSCHKKLKVNPKSEIRNPKFNDSELLNPGWVAVPEKDLPVILPKVKNYQPRDDGQSPLASVKKWVNVLCPKCGGPATRETDTMPNWAGSSWYFMRYCDSQNDKQFASNEKLNYWLPVDWYNGGMEHVTLHLLYSRFWNIFLHDIGLVPHSEPYQKRTAHGLVLGEGGAKMSKSRGNVINPDSLIETFGADSLRLYEMFMGPFADSISWDHHGIVGMSRFLNKVWTLFCHCENLPAGKDEAISSKNPKSEIRNPKQISNSKIQKLLNQTIKKVTEDIEEMKFNTAISALMILVNEIEKIPKFEIRNSKF
jgi:leucyl-tRNA synthetase